MSTHRGELERVLCNETGRASVDNPSRLIMDWKENGDAKLTLATTSEYLTQRLGHALEKAYGGTVHMILV